MKSRLKEQSPFETIVKIRSILNDLGVLVTERWTESQIEGIYSVRIQIVDTDIGTNGKGATQVLALASGYGEFIERLSNGLLLSSLTGDAKQNLTPLNGSVDLAYVLSPHHMIDAVLFNMFSADENLRKGYASYSALGLSIEEKRRRLGMWIGVETLFQTPNVKIEAVPYHDVIAGVTEHIPKALLHAYGSNGMAAGNSYKEALVQGASEIFERYCQKFIIDHRLTPPRISREIIAKLSPRVALYLEQIEKVGGCKVEICDCSLGLGIPVYCICVYNIQTHCYSATFGSHPNAEVAIERVITEVFQGRTAHDVSNRIAAKALPEPYNIKMLFKISMGKYPLEFWRDVPSYPFDASLFENDFVENDSAWNYYLSLCKRLNFKVFVRDVGYLGFPSVHVVIPGCSEVLCCTDFVLRHYKARKTVVALLGRLDECSSIDKELILQVLDFERKIGLIGKTAPHDRIKCAGLALTPVQQVVLFLAVGQAELGHNQEAADFYRKLSSGQVPGQHRMIFDYLSDFYRFLADSYCSDAAKEVLEKFYAGDVIQGAENFRSLSMADLFHGEDSYEISGEIIGAIYRINSRIRGFRSRVAEVV